MITRVRVEAIGKSETDVKDDILGFIQAVRASALHVNPWSEEPPGLEVQTTKQGFWGRLTIRRMDE